MAGIHMGWPYADAFPFTTIGLGTGLVCGYMTGLGALIIGE